MAFSHDGEHWFNLRAIFKGQNIGLRSPDYPIDGAMFTMPQYPVLHFPTDDKLFSPGHRDRHSEEFYYNDPSSGLRVRKNFNTYLAREWNVGNMLKLPMHVVLQQNVDLRHANERKVNESGQIQAFFTEYAINGTEDLEWSIGGLMKFGYMDKAKIAWAKLESGN